MAAKVRQELKAQKQWMLKNYYATLHIRAQFEHLGNLEMVATCDFVLQQCLARLHVLRGQEVLTWPMLLPAH